MRQLRCRSFLWVPKKAISFFRIYWRLRWKQADETLAEDSQNVHLVKAVDKGTEKDTDAETAVWQISGITWKLDEEQSDLPEFHGGISEKTISKNLTRTESRSRLR